MGWVAPWRKYMGGDTTDSSAFTRTFTVNVTAGDLVALTITTSNYPLVVTSVTGGGINFTTNATRERGSGYGNVYVISGTSPTTQLLTVTVQLQNYVNATVYFHQLRWYVFGNHGGVGYAGAWRGGGEAWFTANQTAEKSAFIHAHLDWNVTAPNGTWILDAGAVSDTLIFRGGAAIYWAASHLDSSGLNQKNLGTVGSTSTRLVGGGLEIKGMWVDQTPPSVVSSLTATVLGSSQVRMDWGEATDDVGVVGYYVVEVTDPATSAYVLLGNVPVANPRTFTVSGIAPESTHTYSVIPVDAAGNIGSTGAPMRTVTTPPTVIPVNKGFVGVNKPTLRVGTILVSKLYVGIDQVWP